MRKHTFAYSKTKIMVQFMLDKSGLETRYLGLNTLGTAKSPALSQYVLVNSCPGKLSWDLGLKYHRNAWRSLGSNPQSLVY